MIASASLRRGFLCLALFPWTSGHAQTLDQYNVSIDVPSEDRASVRIQMKFSKTPEVRFSRYGGEIETIEESIVTCEDKFQGERKVPVDSKLYPALVTTIGRDCGKVQLVYDARPATKVPLLLPSTRLGPNARVLIDVRSRLPVTAGGFPQLHWTAGGTGTREMRFLPAFIEIPTASSGRIYWLIEGAVLLLAAAAFGFWVRWKRLI